VVVLGLGIHVGWLFVGGFPGSRLLRHSKFNESAKEELRREVVAGVGSVECALRDSKCPQAVKKRMTQCGDGGAAAKRLAEPDTESLQKLLATRLEVSYFMNNANSLTLTKKHFRFETPAVSWQCEVP
jgi:hypothetical protein